MSERSAVIGLFPDGSMRLRTSLPGYDAFTGPPDGMSFDSEWDDLVKVHQIGIASIAAGYGRTLVPFPDLGYAPFVDVRKLVSNVVYDDYVNDTRYGLGALISSNGFLAYGGDTSIDVIYAIYRIQVPTP